MAMRVLFTCTAHKSHYYPMVPLAWALRTAGHQVVVATPPELTESITGTGMTAVPIGIAGWDDDNDPAAAAMVGQLFADGAVDRVQNFDWGGDDRWSWESLLTMENLIVPTLHEPINNLPLIDDLVELARSWRPDLIIRDPYTWAGGVAARVTGAADARLVWGPDNMIHAREAFLRQAQRQPLEHREDPTAEWLDSVLRRFGHRYDEKVLTGHWTIDTTPPSTRLTGATQVVGVRYVPFNGPAVVPAWLREPPARRRVCVTSGLSTREYGESLYATGDLLDIFADLDVEIIATMSDEERDRIPVIPDNTRVVDFVPLHDLLPTCVAVVHHGGGGSRATAELHGVPQIIATNGWDTVLKAERIQALGAGLCVPLSEATPVILREMLVEVLDDPSFTECARRLRDEVLAEPSPNDIVPLLEKLTAEHRPGTT